jgi:small ligand-binding sensory domain FIST
MTESSDLRWGNRHMMIEIAMHLLTFDNIRIRWGSYVSSLPILELAAKEAVDTILGSIGRDSKPELAVVFVTSSLGSEFDQVVPTLRELVPSLKHIIGCSGYGVIGGGNEGPNEVEGEPALSLSLGQLPDADIHVMHTLRSSIPEPSSTRQDWSDWVGVPYDTPQEVSFMILADPRFSQVEQMVDGLDNAFPESKKIGGILSTASRPRSRALFAWNSADALFARKEKMEQEKRQREMLRSKGRRGPNGSKASAASQRMRKRAARQSQQDTNSKVESKQPEEVEVKKPEAVKADSPPPLPTGPKENVGGFLGTIMRMLTGGDKKKAQTVLGFGSSSSSPMPIKGPGQVAKKARGFSSESSTIEPSSSSSPPSSSSDTSSMFLHGAVMLILHGNVKMDTITSMGYRSPSDRLFKVESLGRPHEIVTVAADLSSSDGGKGTTSQFIKLISGNLNMAENSDSDEEDHPGNEIQAIVAVVDMIEGLGEEFDGNLDELLDTAMLAVARDSGKTAEELQPDDFELLPLENINEEYGVLVVSPSEQLRKGDRFKIMVRDSKALKEDLRDKILAYKKKELLAMMMSSSNTEGEEGRDIKPGEASKPPPPTFGGE